MNKVRVSISDAIPPDVSVTKKQVKKQGFLQTSCSQKNKKKRCVLIASIFWLAKEKR
jgi:hypothetical protein